MSDNVIYVEYRELYDGWAVKYDKDKDKFEWREFVKQRLTDEEIKQCEQSLREELNK